jgi:hypothetical protein
VLLLTCRAYEPRPGWLAGSRPAGAGSPGAPLRCTQACGAVRVARSALVVNSRPLVQATVGVLGFQNRVAHGRPAGEDQGCGWTAGGEQGHPWTAGAGQGLPRPADPNAPVSTMVAPAAPVS